jgi:hypothetical protein
MDPPLTRRETKKQAKDKKSDIYSAKHIRITQALASKRETAKPAEGVRR